MDKKLEQRVWDRARRCCKYCRLPQSARRLRFQIDHVISLQHRGAVQGLMPIGRTTVYVLAMNDPDDLAIRAELVRNGVLLTN